MNKMRVLMVEHSGRSGMYTYTDALCEGLCAAGADVTVMTSTAWSDSPRPFNVERKLSEFTEQQGQSSRLHWAADRFFRSLVNIQRRNKYALEGDFDIVHIQGAGLPLIDQYLLKPLTKKVPVVLTVHDVQSHYERFVSKDSYMKKCFQIPHNLIVHYEKGKKQLIEHWKVPGHRVTVIPHGIMPVKNIFEITEARRKLNLPIDCQILLFFGSLRPNKGLDVLLDALDKIRRHKPEVLLVVAGALPRGMSFEPYSDIIEKLNLSEYVKSFVRFIEDEEVDLFMSASDIVVLPYKNFEAQSGVLLRAYAHRKPVVVSDVGAMGELVTFDKVGLAVESGNVEALTNAVINVLENQDKFQACYNPELENKYNWDHIAEMTLKSYEKTIEKKLRNQGIIK